ncbi:uncharacterized protein LOC114255988 [Camellia sinensis]|uniref:uncharacterized protein LOC114255988 n=1 Tax=Camellia sinensis TaxID=4442 RepID=UPI001035E332|nr:uncharacterized protein LOC114255988 [Camellia sinensis]
MAAWISYIDFQSVVESNWVNSLPSLMDKLEKLACKASEWNKDKFGNIFRNKRWLLGRIEGIQKPKNYNYSNNLHLLEMDLIEQYNKILYQEEPLWFQKSRSNWITQGDRNTKFFHLSTLTKRRKCKIKTLKNESGIWINNIVALKSMIFDYFVEHFQSTPTIQLDHWNNLTLDVIRQEDNDELSREITRNEIWRAVKNIKAFKAPSRDGFQAIFYHNYWETVGPTVCEFVKNYIATSSIPHQINRTLIALIPKIENPETIK